MKNGKDLRLYATKNNCNKDLARVIFFKDKDNKCFLVRGVQHFILNSLDNYEEIVNQVIKRFLIKIHNELIEDLMTKKDLSINLEEFYIDD